MARQLPKNGFAWLEAASAAGGTRVPLPRGRGGPSPDAPGCLTVW